MVKNYSNFDVKQCDENNWDILVVGNYLVWWWLFFRTFGSSRYKEPLIKFSNTLLCLFSVIEVACGEYGECVPKLVVAVKNDKHLHFQNGDVKPINSDSYSGLKDLVMNNEIPNLRETDILDTICDTKVQMNGKRGCSTEVTKVKVGVGFAWDARSGENSMFQG